MNEKFKYSLTCFTSDTPNISEQGTADFIWIFETLFYTFHDV